MAVMTMGARRMATGGEIGEPVDESLFVLANIVSVITSEDLELIRTRFGLSDQLELRVPLSHERVYFPPPDYFPPLRVSPCSVCPECDSLLYGVRRGDGPD